MIGSPDLRRWCSAISEAGRRHRIVLVAGGGPFADVVRDTQTQLGVGDATAHAMAIQGMRQFALALAAITGAGPDLSDVVALNSGRAAQGLSVWDPCDRALDAVCLPRDWRVTSDSLSLALCRLLDCPRLVLVKSRAPLTRDPTASAMAHESFIDAYFERLLKESGTQTWWLERSRVDQLTGLLEGAGMPSNRICP